MNKKTTRKQRWTEKKWIMVFVVVSFIFIILVSYFFGFYPHGNNIFEDLHSGNLKVVDIKSLSFIKHTKSLAVPWTIEGYSKLERTITDDMEIIEGISEIIKISSKEGYSRPGIRGATSPKNYIRIDVIDGFYYILSTEIKYKDYTTIEYLALPKNSTNPNTGRAYNNIHLVDFFKKNDPYYFE